MFSFNLKKTDGRARLGQITTAHGIIDTPVFMPVGTAGTIKAMTADSVRTTGAQIILGNTYHLMLRPGADRVHHLGGLHEMVDWPGPILTDSGGFQVMSLKGLRSMTEHGVTFKSHIDGSLHELTPESSMEIQKKLDATITMAFDECTPYPAKKEQAAISMALSMRWATRSKDAFIERPGYGLFGIVQGSIYEDLRQESVESLLPLDTEGLAIGGLAVGEGQELMFSTLDFTTPMLPIQKPRYLMGVGKPDDLVGAVARGVDMFDCVLPTRSGRTGQAWTWRGQVNLRNARHKDDTRPLDESCSCPACRNHSRAYIHHLVRSDEMLGAMLLTWHNIQFFQDLMKGMRDAISTESFNQFQAGFEATYRGGDIQAL